MRRREAYIIERDFGTVFVDYATLEPGQLISERKYCLDSETVAAYVEAVGDTSWPWVRDRLVPPMAVAALGLRGIIEDLSIPTGTVHAGQELEFRGAVRVGSTVACAATVAQNTVRGGARFVAVALAIRDSQGRDLVTGKSTLVVPAD